MALRLYTTGNCATIEDSRCRVAAESAAQAAELYIQAILDDEISVDMDELEDFGEVEVQADSEEMPTEPGVIPWSREPVAIFQLDQIEAWKRARGSAMEP